MTEAVAGIVIRPSLHAHEVLLLKRATHPYLGEWFPVEGLVEANEVPSAAILRELVEETQLIAVRLHHESTRVVPTDRGEVRIHIFAIFVDGDARVTLNEEHDAFEWRSIDDATALLALPAQRDALVRIRKQFILASG